MHILHVTPYYPPTWAYGGIPRIVDGLSRAQQKLGHQISILTTDVLDAKNRNNLPLYRRESGIAVLNLPNISNRLAYRQMFLPRKRSALEKLSPPHIIHMHGHRHLLNNIAHSFAQKHSIPYVLTSNGTLHRHEKRLHIKRIWDYFLGDIIPKDADRCIAVSNVDIHIHREFGIPKEKIAHIPNGLDLGEFSLLPPKGTFRKKWKLDDRPIVAYLGQISQRKGVEHLIQACQNQHDIQLVIAGNDMGAMDKAQKTAKDHPNIIFTGLLKGKERLELLRDTSVLVYPSTNEIFGLSPFEGLLCGSPAIVCNDCGCGELISHAQAGLLVPYAQPQKLRESIRQLVHDTEMQQIMVHRGREYIRRHLSFERVAEKHLELYIDILQPSSKKHPDDRKA